MKPATLFGHLSLLALFALLMSCETTPSTDRRERDPQALGRRVGRADALAGLSDNYERHLHELHPSADEDEYEDAYDDAYNDAEDEVEKRQERQEEAREYVSGRAYDLGHDAGELDRHRGLSRNPDRHRGASEGSASTRHSWVEGYEDGWDGHSR